MLVSPPSGRAALHQDIESDNTGATQRREIYEEERAHEEPVHNNSTSQASTSNNIEVTNAIHTDGMQISNEVIFHPHVHHETGSTGIAPSVDASDTNVGNRSQSLTSLDAVTASSGQLANETLMTPDVPQDVVVHPASVAENRNTAIGYSGPAGVMNLANAAEASVSASSAQSHDAPVPVTSQRRTAQQYAMVADNDESWDVEMQTILRYQARFNARASTHQSVRRMSVVNEAPSGGNADIENDDRFEHPMYLRNGVFGHVLVCSIVHGLTILS